MPELGVSCAAVLVGAAGRSPAVSFIKSAASLQSEDEVQQLCNTASKKTSWFMFGLLLSFVAVASAAEPEPAEKVSDGFLVLSPLFAPIILMVALVSVLTFDRVCHLGTTLVQIAPN